MLVVALLERPAGTAKLLRAHGVPDHKMIVLRPDWQRTKGATPVSEVAG
jgi:hypothetical protein